MKFYFLLFLYLITETLYAQSFNISKEDAKDDLRKLRDIIIDFHPDPFRYISKDKWELKYKSVLKKIDTDSIKTIDLLRWSLPLTTSIRDEHLNMTPSPKEWDLMCKEGLFFPFELDCIDNKKLKIRASLDGSPSKLKGKEIKSINGIPSSEIIELVNTRWTPSASSDYSGTIYHAFNFNNFSRFFKVCVSSANDFKISFQDGSTINVDGQKINYSGDGLLPFIKVNKEPKPLIDIKKNASAAYLRLFTFMPLAYDVSLNKTVKELDKFFENLEENNISKLVIDLRGNRGGTPFMATYLASFFFPRPFQPFQKITTRNLSKEVFPKKFKGLRKPYPSENNKELFLLKKLEAAFRLKKPNKNQFSGKVIILIDDGVGSAASIFSSLISNYKNVTFIGSESGGDCCFTTGGQFKTFVLKHSEIRLEMPLLLFHHNNYKNKTFGIQPDQQQLNFENILENYHKYE